MGLIAAETNGRSQDTEALYREHGAAVAAFCGSLLRDRAETEDATQQVFLSAHRAILNGTVPREPLAWLLAVARNECYARFRQRAVAALPAGELPDGTAADASVQVLRAGELAHVWDEVGRMPQAQREAFLLREIRGLSYGQLADELSLSPPSVRSLLLRARARLRQRLRDVAALGSTPWLQGLLRLVGGGDGSSPVPAATKAAAVGLGALALVGGGDMPRSVHHASTSPTHASGKHRAPAVARRHVAAPLVSAAAPHEGRSEVENRGSEPRQSSKHDDSSGSDSSAGHDGGGAESSTESGRDGGSDGSTATTPVAQPTTDGHDGGSSGSDGGSDSTTTTTSTTTTSTTTTATTTTDSSGSSGGSSPDGG
jgi:RNA polymerase sigma-70 factor, ECF subfamily